MIIKIGSFIAEFRNGRSSKKVWAAHRVTIEDRAKVAHHIHVLFEDYKRQLHGTNVYKAGYIQENTLDGFMDYINQVGIKGWQ